MCVAAATAAGSAMEAFMGSEAAVYTASALSAASHLYGGISKKNAMDAQAEQAKNSAAAAESQGRVQAQQIRGKGRAQASAAQAAYGASGVETGTGSALKVTSDIVGRAEHDAWASIFSGQNKASQLDAQAQAAQQQGKIALTSSVLKTGTSALWGAGKAGKWKKAAGGKTPPPYFIDLVRTSL